MATLAITITNTTKTKEPKAARATERDNKPNMDSRMQNIILFMSHNAGNNRNSTIKATGATIDPASTMAPSDWPWTQDKLTRAKIKRPVHACKQSGDDKGDGQSSLFPHGNIPCPSGNPSAHVTNVTLLVPNIAASSPGALDPGDPGGAHSSETATYELLDASDLSATTLTSDDKG